MGFLPNIGVPELLIVLVIAILILGPKRIPAAAKSIGHGMRNFRDSVGGGGDEKDELDEQKATIDEKPKTEA
jgi:sec-independent protein translocase protein TatA